MTGRVWMAAAAVSSAFALAACSESKSGPISVPPSAYVEVTPAASSVIADGTNTVRVDFTNTGSGTATLSTSQGTFESSGLTTVTTTAPAGSETLRTCAFGSAGCTSEVTTLRISAPSGSASATISFRSRQAACRASCISDPNCGGLACTIAGGGDGACANGSCVAGAACAASPAGATTETSCSDGVDNDCSGKKDCGEASCDGVPCKSGAPTFACRSGACTDLSSGLAVTVTPARTRLPAIGGASTDVDVAVTYEADPAPNLTISVALSDGALGTIAPLTALTDADGKARFRFTGNAATGAEVITARIVATPSVSATATITLPRLASLRLVTGDAGGAQSVQFPVMGAKDSGWQDLGWIRVQAVDDLGLPYPDGLPVRFEHQQLGGNHLASRSTLGTPLTPDTPTCVADRGCVGHQAVTASTGGPADSAGVARAWIYAGTVAGTLRVTASASAAGASFGVQLPDIAVVGAKASGTNFSVVCSPRNLPALAETDCAISLVDAPFTCEAILKDRFSNVLGRSTQVIFASEASAVGQVTWTPAYAADKPGSGQMSLGVALQGFNTLGAGLPFDVAPLTTVGEPGVLHALDGCGERVHNPRDGVVTIIAVADGEEALFDANGNGSYDVGEPFVDLGEPFVDQDDDGVWTDGEWFLDLDGNGRWTGPNGAWDANTKVWTQTYVVYSGAAQRVEVGERYMGARIADAIPDACVSTSAAPSFEVLFATTASPATSRTYDVVASDLNFNRLCTRTSYKASVRPAEADLKATNEGLPSYGDLTGMDWRFWPCANGGSGDCASQCRGPGACRMRPEFTHFSCGLKTKVTVTGGGGPAKGDLQFEIDVPWQRYGTGLVQHDVLSVSGVAR